MSQEKVALVTGVSSEIGRAIAGLLSRHGFTTVQAHRSAGSGCALRARCGQATVAYTSIHKFLSERSLVRPSQAAELSLNAVILHAEIEVVATDETGRTVTVAGRTTYGQLSPYLYGKDFALRS